MQRDLYFDWLIDKICCGTSAYKRKYFGMLLNQLYLTDYTWNESFPLDEDRATWGLQLRIDFKNETNRSIGAKDLKPCSMLEMMVMLSIQIEDGLSLESDDDFYEHVSDWFWGMISNMGLNKSDDYNYSNQKTSMAISRVLGRTYGRNGKGGLFTLTINEKHVDMKNVDIWMQAMLYRAELDKINDPDWLEV